jgi:hypothetical protein
MPIDEPIPVGPLRLAIKLPEAAMGHHAKMLVSNRGYRRPFQRDRRESKLRLFPIMKWS